MSPKDYKIIKDKRLILNAELAIIIAIALITNLLFKIDIIHNEWIQSCSPKGGLSYPQTDSSIAKTMTQMCRETKIIAFTSITYTFLCALMIASPLRATPAMLFSGVFLSRKDNNNAPNIIQASRYVIFGFFPIYVGIIYTIHNDFILTLDQSALALGLFGTIFSAKHLYEHWHYRDDFVFNESVSGLEHEFTDKKQRALEKKFNKKLRWYQYCDVKFRHFPLGLIVPVLLFSLITINILRAGTTPANYVDEIYDEYEITKTNNGFFALAGLSAPENTKDTYTFGKEYTLPLAQNFLTYKQLIGLSPTKINPNEAHFLPTPEYNALKWDSLGAADFKCIYNIQATPAPNCPTENDVKAAIQNNNVLWERFNALGDYNTFEQPPLPVFTKIYYQTIISLAHTKAAEIILLQKSGQSTKAINQWLRFMKLYLNFSHMRLSSVTDKYAQLMLINIQTDTLETLLYNAPEMARQYGDEINTLLSTPDNIAYFHANSLFKDDYQRIEPTFAILMNSPYIQKQTLRCFEKIKTRVDQNAFDYISTMENPFCNSEFPRDPTEMVKQSFTSPGFFLSNIIQGLLMPGALKGQEIITAMHMTLNKFTIARLTIRALQNNIRPENIQGFLNAQPPEFQDKILNTPYIWDGKNNRITTRDIRRDGAEKYYYINLGRK